MLDVLKAIKSNIILRDFSVDICRKCKYTKPGSSMSLYSALALGELGGEKTAARLLVEVLAGLSGPACGEGGSSGGEAREGELNEKRVSCEIFGFSTNLPCAGTRNFLGNRKRAEMYSGTVAMTNTLSSESGRQVFGYKAYARSRSHNNKQN